MIGHTRGSPTHRGYVMFTPICLFETEYLGPRGAVLIEFDQSTMANMTAALEHVCRKIPADIDNYETRKFIADAMMASARAGKRSLINFQEAGLEALTKLARPKKRAWPWLWRNRKRKG
jgi:hypothetical protein